MLRSTIMIAAAIALLCVVVANGLNRVTKDETTREAVRERIAKCTIREVAEGKCR